MSTIDSLPALDSAAHGGCPSAPCSVSFLSVCSGIEAASVAWEPLGWKACGFAEIEKFPSAVLAHHWPETPNMGDMTKHHEWPNTLRPDLIVGGTPCQAFSVAGLRQGLADPRGNLTLVFLGLLEQLRPRWVVWENVPGVLSDKTGAFGAFLGGLGELGYGFAYRILDAQHFGVPQRRRRVFVVGYLGDWRRAAAVLFEPESMRGDHPPRREAGQISPTIPARSLGGGGLGTDFDCDGGLIAHSLRGEGFDASEDGTGRGTPLVPVAIQAGAMKENPDHGPDGIGVRTDGVAYTLEARAEVQAVAYRTSGNCGAWPTGDKTDALTTSTDPFSHVLAFSSKDHGADAGTISPTLRSMGHDGSHANGGGQVAVAFAENSRHELRLEGGDGTRCGALCTGGGKPGQGTPCVATAAAVRRLTPRECERLQGFPDDHTRIPWRGKMAPDGPRYKALGNSMAVPVMRWIGERISRLNSDYPEQLSR
jgi:DNA (cytosine-5)-methyltransferase 1